MNQLSTQTISISFRLDFPIQEVENFGSQKVELQYNDNSFLKALFEFLGPSSYWSRCQKEISPERVFFKRRSSDSDFCEQSEACGIREYWLENRGNSASITHFYSSHYQCFQSNNNVGKLLNDSFSKSKEFLCGTLIGEIKWPLTENDGSEYGDDTKVIAKLGVSEVSGSRWENQAKFNFNCRIIHKHYFDLFDRNIQIRNTLCTSGELWFECRDESLPETAFGSSELSTSSCREQKRNFQLSSKVCGFSGGNHGRKQICSVEIIEFKYLDNTKVLTFFGALELSVFYCVAKNQRFFLKVFFCSVMSSDWKFLEKVQTRNHS